MTDTPHIRQLPDHLVNQIAAGEVIERPASVLKEILENALDAKATQIDIDSVEAGLKSLRVTDNGLGIAQSQLSLAVCRHATSKIQNSDDLNTIKTFGFRGEALAAIAAVSHLTLNSRPPNQPFGCGIKISAGEVRQQAMEIGMNVGTEIEVADLFYNIPARRKFLRKEVTEKGHLEEALLKAALFASGVGFKVSDAGKTKIQIAANATLESRIAILLQPKEDLIEVKEEALAPGGIGLSGFLSAPQSQYGHRERYYLFINGRAIRDRLLSHAITQAYREVTPYGNFPCVVLNLHLPFDFYDINVHPAKTEVRFRQPQALHHFLFSTLRKVLQTKPLINRPPDPVLTQGAYRERSALSHLSLVQETNVSSLPLYNPAFSTQPHSPSTQESIFSQTFFSGLKVLAQWQNSFILCENPSDTKGDLIFIDQHAAAERIGYERLKTLYKSKSISKQFLLLEEAFVVSNLEMGLLLDFIPQFEDLGFEVHCDVDRHEIRFMAIPAILKKESLNQLLKTLVNDLASYGRSAALEDALDLFLMTLACHTTVRANHRLTPQEMQALLESLDHVDFSQKCPHGRPVVVAVTRHDIEERFLRR